jgi:amidase
MATSPDRDADVAYFPLTELQRMIQRREIGSVELLELFGRRIAAQNPALNAVVVSDTDRAMGAARRADQASYDVRTRPLHGIPMTVKESFDVTGLATTRGVPERAGRRGQRIDRAEAACCRRDRDG